MGLALKGLRKVGLSLDQVKPFSEMKYCLDTNWNCLWLNKSTWKWDIGFVLQGSQFASFFSQEWELISIINFIWLVWQFFHWCNFFIEKYFKGKNKKFIFKIELMAKCPAPILGTSSNSGPSCKVFIKQNLDVAPRK